MITTQLRDDEQVIRQTLLHEFFYEPESTIPEHGLPSYSKNVLTCDDLFTHLTDPIVPAPELTFSVPLLSVDPPRLGSAERGYLFRTLIRTTNLPELLELGYLHWVARIRRQLQEFESLKTGWDSEGGLAPSKAVLDDATEVLEQIIAFAIQNEIEEAPIAVPLPDGTVRFEWAVGNKELFLTVGERHTIEAQRWEPRSAVDSIYYEEIPLSELESEMGWLRA
jgi:hypothetical protein